jgi:integrase
LNKPSWLKAVEHDKRATKEEPIFVDDALFVDLVKMIKSIEWPYKSKYRDELHTRDQALVSLLILTGLRITEALRLLRKQFRIYDDHVLLMNVDTVKHGLLRKKIILPKLGRLAPFTEIFEAWLKQVQEPESYVFPSANCDGTFNFKHHLTRYRAHTIIKKTCGKFPHWLRAVAENIYGRIVFRNNSYKLKDFMGLINLESTSPYVQAAWEEDENRIYQL